MKKRSFLDNVATWGVRLAVPLALNQAAYTYMQPKWSSDVLSRESELDLTKVYIPGLESAAPHLDARDFVNLANSEVHRIVSEGVETVPVCRNYAEATEKVAVGLMEQAGKGSLKNCLERRVDGEHVWLTIREGNSWVDYETMHEPQDVYGCPLELNTQNVKDYSRRSARSRAILNGDPYRKAHAICKSNSECRPTPESLSAVGDAVC